jgi:quinol monooxygenase YgiN
MATVLFVVKATIRPDQEAAFNRWYNEEHVPQVLQFKGLVSARRYKALEGEDKYQYMAVYELQDEATYRRLMASDHMKALRAEYDAHFGAASERARFAYTQVWP